jgi:hypothetical protein
MEINWTISSLECKTNENGLTNVVYKVYWKCIVTETIGETTYSSEMSASLNIPSPNPDNFIQYESLTEEQVITWVKDTFGVVGVQEIYDLLQNNINEQINPTIISLTPPWE